MFGNFIVKMQISIDRFIMHGKTTKVNRTKSPSVKEVKSIAFCALICRSEQSIGNI